MEKKCLKDRETIRMTDIVEPDNELLVWEKWIKIRSEESANLAMKTNRPPVDLTMNLLQKVRENKERKIVLEHAQVDPKAAIRGGPWEQPLRLKQTCVCKPVYEVKRTAVEMGTPQIIEHIGVPQFIEETEKGLSGVTERKTCYQLDTDYKQYRGKREEKLGKKIKKIDPFRPDLSDLIVRGNKPKPPKKKTPPLPIITYDECTVTPETTSVYAVRINNTIFYKDIPDQKLPHNIYKMRQERWHENCSSWSYYFKIPAKRAGRCKLYLENLGTVTLRYCWRKVKKNIPFIPEEIYEQVFFFNKNEDVLSPGQNKVLFFTFVSDKPGIHSETWELSFCNICFFDSLADKFMINLSADSVEDLHTYKRKVEILKAKIDKKAIINIVTYILRDIITEVTSVKPQKYPYKEMFLEGEMFVMKNPVCYYHQTEVMRMKEMYAEMLPDEAWDISIGTWRQKMMEKEYEDRMKYYEFLKKSQSELLKPWDESEDISLQKYRAMKWLLGEMADKFDMSYERSLDVSGVRRPTEEYSLTSNSQLNSSFDLDPVKVCKMRNIFYLYTLENVATTIEMCAGVLSSIDLNRWIQFDFCRI